MKQFYLRFTEEEYHRIPSEIVMRAIILDDDYTKYKNDPDFIKLYKANRKTKKDLEDWKYNKRHEK